MIRRPLPKLGTWTNTLVDNVLVRTLVSGRGPDLVLIHGLSGSVQWWERNIPGLARRYRVHALDLLQYHPEAERLEFAFAEAARHLAAWMDAAGLSSAHLVGHSMGGAIAAQFAADFPSRVRKLVLVNAAAIFPRARLPLSPLHLVRKAPRFPATLVPVILKDAWRTGPRLLWAATRDLLSTDLRPKLPQIEAETLVIWGAHDGILPLTLAQELASHLKRGQLLVLPQSGHSPMWEQPEEFNESVTKFLERKDSALG